MFDGKHREAREKERIQDDRHVHASHITRRRILGIIVENNIVIDPAETIEHFRENLPGIEFNAKEISLFLIRSIQPIIAFVLCS
jgi:hypothetical protein